MLAFVLNNLWGPWPCHKYHGGVYVPRWFLKQE